MPIATILYLTLAAILALGFVFFAYFFKNKNLSSQTYFLGAIRFISIFTLLILLINPKIKQTEFETVKPKLVLAIDGSESIENLEKKDSLQSLVKRLKKNEALNAQFEISAYNFGGDLEVATNDSSKIDRNKTDIYNAIAQLNKLYKDKPTALVLFSDGNSTYGQDYEFFKLNENIILNSVVTGDTATTFDLSINALNLNKYAFLNNQFPVEIFLNYSGNDAIKTNFQLKAGNSILFSKTINFDKENSSEIINTTLTAKQLGTIIYEASITSSQNEKNEVNNKRKFAVEVIDERTNILLLSDISHPDLGALKKSIENNKQREVMLKDIDSFNILELIQNVFDLLEMKAAKKDISLVFDLSYKEPIMVNADMDRLQQVISNLIVNSIKYGKKGGTTEVSIENLIKNKVIIRVSDNGEGIEKANIPRLFERFFRVDKSGSRKEGGSGLGLSIVKHILEAHHEKIYVESVYGVGSEFSFTLEKTKNRTKTGSKKIKS